MKWKSTTYFEACGEGSKGTIDSITRAHAGVIARNYHARRLGGDYSSLTDA